MKDTVGNLSNPDPQPVVDYEEAVWRKVIEFVLLGVLLVVVVLAAVAVIGG